MNNNVIRSMSRTGCYNYPCILAKQRIKYRVNSLTLFREKRKSIIFRKIPKSLNNNAVRVLSQLTWKSKNEPISISNNVFIEDENIGDITRFLIRGNYE